MKLVYPAIFIPYDDETGGYAVEFPDLPGCVTGGDDITEAILMAEDAASGWILTELEDGNKVPKATPVENVKTEGNQFVSAIVLDMDTYTAKYGKHEVNKTLAIPAWLNTTCENHDINFSKVFQEALITKIQMYS